MIPAEGEAGERVVVAVSSNSACKDGIKWALAQKIKRPEDILVFLHVVTRIPSPMGMEMYQSEVSNTIFVHYVRTIVQPMMLQLKKLVDPKVNLQLKVGRNNSKEKGIVEEAKKLKATCLVLGTSSRGVFSMGSSRRSKSTSTGSYCVRAKPAGVSVFVIQKDKVVMSKESDGTSPDSSTSTSPANSGRLSVAGLSMGSIGGSGNLSMGSMTREGGSLTSSGMLSPTVTDADRQFSRGSSQSSSGSGEVLDEEGRAVRGLSALGEQQGNGKLPAQGAGGAHGKGMSPAARLMSSRAAKYGTWNGSSGAGDEDGVTMQTGQDKGIDSARVSMDLDPSAPVWPSHVAVASGSGEKTEVAEWTQEIKDRTSTQVHDIDNRLAKARAALAAFPATVKDTFSEGNSAVTDTAGASQSVDSAAEEEDFLASDLAGEGSAIENALLRELHMMRKKAAEAERARVEAEKRAEQLMAAADLSLREVEAHNKRREIENAALVERAMVSAEEARATAQLEAQRTELALHQARSALELEARRRKEAEEKARHDLASSKSLRRYRQFSWEELRAASENFREDRKLGEGGFGTVYFATLHHTPVAVKILKNTNSLQAANEFQREVEVLGQIQHPHTVMLLGCCPEKYALVYEFMANGSLEDRLACKNDTPPLSWSVRVRVAAEVSQALLVLHTQPVPIVHRDLKPANILLDKNFVAKIGDVGLARLMPELNDNRTYMRESTPVGTFAYVDPEFQRTGEFGPKSDVYALGIVLLDLLTGRKPSVYEHLEEAVDDGDLEKLQGFLDERAGRWPLDIAMDMAKLGVRCSEMRRKKRPELEQEVMPTLERLQVIAAKAEEAEMQRRYRPGLADAPSSLFCPITQEIMVNPVLASDGHTYELVAIQQWLEKNDRSPMTNVKLPNKDLVPNHAVKSMIQEFQERIQQPP